jgi:UDP-glucose 4-epimerase
MTDLAGSRVLVIGGAGFLGSHIVDQLVVAGAREIVVLDNFVRGTRRNLEPALTNSTVKLVEGSITDVALLADVMSGIDVVFHLAALWLHECVHEPRKAITVNVIGTFNVVEAAHIAGVKRVVYSSSASVYGDAVETPMTELHPFNNRTMYGATKIAGEQFFRAFHEQHALDYVALRYMNIYGPRMDYKGSYVSVIMKVLDRIERGEAPIISGDGTQAYDFVHVHDVARANILAAQASVTDDHFNIGTGVRTTIRQLVDRLLDLTGSDLTPEFRPEDAMFVRHRVGSTEKSRRELGFEATIDLARGLASVVDWRRSEADRSAQVA